jgi:hypothetical protein
MRPQVVVRVLSHHRATVIPELGVVGLLGAGISDHKRRWGEQTSSGVPPRPWVTDGWGRLLVKEDEVEGEAELIRVGSPTRVKRAMGRNKSWTLKENNICEE